MKKTGLTSSNETSESNILNIFFNTYNKCQANGSYMLRK